jgi:acyl dehydratase
MLNYEGILNLRLHKTVRYSDRDTMLYALCVGAGHDPLNEKELPFVYEKNLAVLPSMATVLADTFDDPMLAREGVNVVLLLLGEERLTLHRPLPSQATITYDVRVKEVVDKGKDKGALIVTETEATLDDATPLYTLQRIVFARGDGGFGGPAEGAPPAQPVPVRKPDTICTFDTRPDQPLFCRLLGDRTPLHAEPAVFRAAGFERPLLHGLTSYGMACRAILSTQCNYDVTRIKSFNGRFSSPAFGGDTLAVEIWDEGSYAAFRVKVKETDVVVLSNGRCVFA